MVRPRKADEDVEDPDYFEDLIRAMGAEPADYPMKLRCCGGSLIATHRRAALSMVHNLLENAVDRHADVIATACPLCQINLECYQNHVNQELGTQFNVPIMYFTQLLGLALGISPKKLEIGKELVSTKDVVAHAKPKAVAS
jgi:heterodisulfide reductase subunit B